MTALPDAPISVPCPKCGQKSKQKISRLKTSPKLTCPACGAIFHVEAKQFRAGLEKVEKALADFRKKLGKGFKL